MDLTGSDNLKAEKANAMLRYRCVPDIARLFRFVELCLAFCFLSWTSVRLPFAVGISVQYCRQFFATIVSPAFIFLLGNLIVITLLFKSGNFSPQSPTCVGSEEDLCDEFLRSNDECPNSSESSSPMPEPEEIVRREKRTVREVSTVTPSYNGSKLAKVADAVSESKPYRRSQSDNSKREGPAKEKPCGELRRSQTEKCLKVASSGDIQTEAPSLVDKLSSEEFQRTIEAFIAKQVRFHQEEKMAIVLHNNHSEP